MRFRFSILPVLPFLLFGCASVQQRKASEVSKLVYAENAAIHARRFDLAEKFSNEAVRIVPPPKKAVDVKPIQNFVVVPEEDNGKPAKDISTIAKEHPEVSKQLAQEDKDLREEDKAVNKVIQAESHASQSKKGFHFGFLSSILVGSPVVLVVAFGVIALFFPELLPVLFSLLGSIRRAGNTVLAVLGGFLKGVRK